MKNITLETITNDTIYAVEIEDNYGRNWITGTMAELTPVLDRLETSEDEWLSDIDIACNQPEHLLPYFEAYEAFRREHRWVPMSPEEFFPIWKEVA